MVSFWGLNLSRIDPNILAGAVHKMRVAKVRNAQLTTIQIARILRRVVDISHLRVLDIRDNESTRYVNPDLKRESLRILERFDFDDTWKCQHGKVFVCWLFYIILFIGSFYI
eukprot:GFUD01040929.1.p1 GENE.GFUD01040929.1~~GFUD01040929.1.p1  ORF type:complete len:129 (-),score=5.95 GFUD01040929.1:34-369(-)